MSEVNIDAALVRGGEAALSRTEERLIEMTSASDEARGGLTPRRESGRPAPV